MPDDQRSATAEWRSNWALVAAATGGTSLVAIGTASLGVMMEPLEQEFGWSRTQITLGTSLLALIGMTLGTFTGMAIDRIGARPIGILAALLVCCGIGGLSLVDQHLWQWLGLWALVGCAASAMPTVWVTSVASHFNTARGLAVAITLSGTGITTSVVPIVAHELVTAFGWRGAYLGLACIWGIVALPLVLLFFRNVRPRPAPAGQPDTAAPAAFAELPGLSARQGFGSVRFYKLAFAAFFSMAAGVAIVMNLVPVLRSTGQTPQSAAALASIIGIATIVGRVFGGWLMDRLSASVIAAVASAGASALPLALLIFPGSITAAAIGVGLYGLFGGAKVSAVAYLASRHFGQRAFGTLYGAVNTVIALGGVLAPLAANIVYDLTKSYTPVMWTAVPFVLFAALIYLSLGSYPDYGKDPA